MEQLGRLEEARRLSAAQAAAGERIGLVPTMGYLHEGHLSLMRLLRPRCERLWVSIFVNPAQFGPGEDLARYPRDLERDLVLCADEGVDVVLHPGAEEVYPAGHSTWITPGPVAERYCGASRPGHFRGVLSIVQRLFAWSRCSLAAFGAKDAQQLWLIQRMVRDLELPVEIVEGPVIREADGLALSSRNVFLSAGEREAAALLNRALALGVGHLEAGAAPEQALQAALEPLLGEGRLALEYLHVADWSTLESLAAWPAAQDPPPVPPAAGERIVLLACRAGHTRLIDNRRCTPKGATK
jgi:pantoate--beta-alanine ligase